MDFECIIYEKEDRIALIKLNRPKVLNAMNKQLWLDFQVALEDVKNDPEIKALIITGEGRAFSTGADLKESKVRSIEEYREYQWNSRKHQKKSSALKSRQLPLSMVMPWDQGMNWPLHVISGFLPRKPRLDHRKPR